MVELIEAVGNIDRSAALKALITWVDLGVLKEDTEDTFRLLEVAEEPSAEPRERRTSMFTLCDIVIKSLILGIVPVVPEVPPVASAQQQQAEKMKVYWKVRDGDIIPIRRHDKYIAIVYRRHADESRSTSGRQDTIHAQNSPRVRSNNRAARCVSGGSQKRGTTCGTRRGMETESVEAKSYVRYLSDIYGMQVCPACYRELTSFNCRSPANGCTNNQRAFNMYENDRDKIPHRGGKMEWTL